MKIRFLDNTNIRLDPSDLSVGPIGIIYSGMEIEVENALYNGEAIDGIHTYFRDGHGWYYWTGKTAILHTSLPVGRTSDINHAPEQEANQEQILVLGQPKSISKTPIFDFEEEKKVTNNLYEEVAQEVIEVTEPIETLREPIEVKETNLNSRGVGKPLSGINLNTKKQYKYKAFTSTNLLYQENFIHENLQKKLQLTGENIIVGILDTGIALEANINFQKVIGVKNFLNTDAKLEDYDGQGTFIAELIAGQTVDNYIGIAPEVHLVIGKIKETIGDNLNYNTLRNSITWAVNYGAKIVLINGGVPDQFLNDQQRKDLKQLIQEHTNAGVLFIVSVGDSSYIKPVNNYPAVLDTCLAVGAHGKDKQRLPKSLRSLNLDVLAPAGPDFYAFTNTVTGPAAAYVTGFMALIMELMIKSDTQLTPRELIRLTRHTAITTSKGKTIDTGYGVIHLEGIVEGLNIATRVKFNKANY